MAPNPLTPIAEEPLPLPQFPIETHELDANANIKEDRGCVFFFDKPQLKGNFYDDSFFRDAQKNYEEAVKDLLSKVELESILPNSPSNMSTYKDLREQNQMVETQAYGLTELEDKYQIVVDVKGYSASDVSVKAVGDLELIVEAKKTETSPDGKSVTSSFSRRFELPGYVRLEAVSSALSKDGILTVSAPKLNPAPAPIKSTFANNSKSEPLQVNGNTLHGNFFDERQRMSDQGLSHMLNDLELDSRNTFQNGFRNEIPRQQAPVAIPAKNISSDVIEESDHYKIVLDTTGYTPNDISVKALGDRELQIDGNHVEKSNTGSETSKNFSRRFCLPGLVKLEAITSSLSPDGRLTIRAPKKEQPIQNASAINQSHLHGVPVNNSVQQNSQNFSKVYTNENVAAQPTSTFDDFFNDDFGMGSLMPRRSNPSSFMEKARNEYEESMRNMRNRHFALDTQPSSFFNDFPVIQTTEDTSDVVESENDYKVKLDVSKYGPKDISVKAVGDRELLIEGKQIKKQSGGPEVSQCFSRKFSLPGLVKFEAITSSLSPDGVLTITAPKA